MTKKHKLRIFLLFALTVALLSGILFYGQGAVILNPKGTIAEKERHLLILSTLLMLIVVIPVFFLTFYFAWKYRAGNHRTDNHQSENPKVKYTPNWDSSILLETIWIGIPCIIILILSIKVWTSSHELDPFKPLNSDAKPVTIQVVALQWKWLFIYPEHDIATVNFVQFPEKTPLNFLITADSPMNSFWIPQLGGQIYAMPGMTTKLHLFANEPGTFRGSSANLSGVGFASMNFTAKASSHEEFTQWVESIRQNPNSLTQAEYTKLIEPSEHNPIATYVMKDQHLFHNIVMKYMMPMSSPQHSKEHHGISSETEVSKSTY